jgi:hypothetical protein
VAEAHRARIEPHGDGCHGALISGTSPSSVRAKQTGTKNPADFRRVPDMDCLLPAPKRTADGAGTRFSAISDSDTHTMADVKTADVAGALFTNQ